MCFFVLHIHAFKLLVYANARYSITQSTKEIYFNILELTLWKEILLTLLYLVLIKLSQFSAIISAIYSIALEIKAREQEDNSALSRTQKREKVRANSALLISNYYFYSSSFIP